MKTGLTFCFALVMAAGLASAQTDDPAAPQAWDQERVTALAQQLADAVKDLRFTVRGSPDQPVGGQRRAQYAAREDLRLLQSQTRRLAALLDQGEAKDETFSVFRRIEQIRRSAEDNGARAMISEAIMEKIGAARKILSELEPFYAE